MNSDSQRIYLDYSATTPIDPEVNKVITYHLAETHGNASSIHSYGRRAKVILEESREVIAKSIGAEPSEVFFTSGGTESDNHALIGGALALRRDSGKDHIVVSSIEHHAVLDSAEYLQSLGFRISYIPVDSFGRIAVEELKNLITPKTGIISVMHANNEIGTIQPLNDVAKISKSNGILFHSDTVQTFGKIPVDVRQLGADIISLSSHKVYGPKGIGAIYLRKGVHVDALLHGGSQERNNRAGTENVPLIAGFAKAVELSQLKINSFYQQAENLKLKLQQKLQNLIKGIIINGDGAETLPHILSVSLNSNDYEAEAESLIVNLDLHGIAASSGSACTSGSIQPSHVLLAMGRDVRTTQATIRFSFGRFTTVAEIEKAGDIFCSIVHSLPKVIHTAQ